MIIGLDGILRPDKDEMFGIRDAAGKPIASRRVLLDWATWAEEQNIGVHFTSGRHISVSELDAVAKWQGLPPDWAQPGDILFVRTGWLAAYNALEATDRATLPWPWSTDNASFVSASR